MVLHSLALQLNFTDEDISKLDRLTKQKAFLLGALRKDVNKM